MGSFETRVALHNTVMRSLAFLILSSALVKNIQALPVADDINQDIELENAIIEEDDELVGEEVKGEMARFMDDMELGGLEQVPALSGRVLSGMANLGGLQAERVMEETPPLGWWLWRYLPCLHCCTHCTQLEKTERMLRHMDEKDFWLPRAEEVTDLPPADRVMGGGEQEGSKPGGDGKMKLNLNLKDLDGNPSDLTVGAAAVGLMHHAVKSKGPDDNQVNAIAGFGHQIMQLVDEIEKEKKEEDKA